MSAEQPLFRTYPEEVGTLDTEMHTGKLALPDFQRSFIWPARNTASLLSSLMARYPAGVILSWRPGEFKLADRPVEGAPAIPQGIGLPDRLILDGQQRLTAIYRAVHGVGEAHFNVDLKQFLNRETFALSDHDEIDWEAVVRAYEPSARQRKARADSGELPEYERPEWQLSNWEFPVKSLQSASAFDEWLDKIIAELPPGKDVDLCKKQMREVRTTYIDQLRNYEFPVTTLTDQVSLQAVCRIFETLNSSGVRLGVYEILTARFYPDGIDLRKLWREAKEKYAVLRDPSQDKDPDGFSIDPYTVLQVISLRTHNSPQQKVVSQDLKAVEVSELWDAAVDALRELVEHLRDACGVIHRDLLPYQMLLVPMAGAWLERATLPGPQQGAALEKLEHYFWASAFTTNYDQGGASQAEKDYRDLVSWLNNKKNEETGADILPEAIGTLEISAQVLLTATIRKKALLRALMALTAKAGARDFHNGQPLTPQTYLARKYDSHHVFPKKRLTDTDAEARIDPAGNSPELILNRALVDSGTNRRIGAKKPSVYIGDIQEEGVDVESVLASHLIDVADLKANDYNGFIHARLQAVIAQIETATGRSVTPLPPDAVSSGEEADVEASEEDEGL